MPESGDLPGMSPGFLLRIATASDNQLSRSRGVEDEEDGSDKVAAAWWSLIPPAAFCG